MHGKHTLCVFNQMLVQGLNVIIPVDKIIIVAYNYVYSHVFRLVNSLFLFALVIVVVVTIQSMDDG
jgi:ABC-type multidrug transport system permease subunit